METSHRAGNGYLAYGDWMNLSSGVPNTMEILMGERPGGFFCAFLMVEAKGEKYRKEASGRPILPIFRLGDAEINLEEAVKSGKAPVFEPGGPVFSSQ